MELVPAIGIFRAAAADLPLEKALEMALE